MEIALSILVGLGLSAACGFRVFVPLLVASVAGRVGYLRLSAGFDWMTSDVALIAFAVATVLEVGAYYVPWVDHLLDSVATPAAVVAGTLMTASVVTDMDPFLKWTLALIAGGGIAGVVQGTTVVARGVSTAATAGLGNPIVATAELGGALTASMLSLVTPAAVIFLIAGALGWAAWRLVRRRSVLPAPLPR